MSRAPAAKADKTNLQLSTGGIEKPLCLLEE